MGKPVTSNSDLLANPHDRGLAPSRLPVWAQRSALGLFALGIIAASAFAFTEHWRRATFILGVTLVFLSVLRLTCDSKIMGFLAVRSRKFDAIYTAILGTLMTFLAVSVDALGS